MHQLTTSTWLCVLALMVTSPYCHAGSVLSFKATPSVIKTDLTRQVMMRCEVAAQPSRSASTDQDVARLTQYVVTLANGSVVAEVNSDHAKGFIDEGNLRVAGSVSGTGYIQLTWARPSEMSITTYKCQVHARSKTNTFVQLKASLTLSSEVPTIADLVTHINEIEQEYKEADKNQVTHINEIEQEYKEADKNQVACAYSQRAAFMVVLDKKLTFSNKNPITYDKVLLDTDSGYNAGTGEFVVKSPGIYSISANIVSYDKSNCIQLHVNSVAITSTLAYQGDSYKTGSLSAAVALQKNDKVKVVKRCSGSAFYWDSNIHQANTFSGVLVSPDACLA